jgi:hypothetical protein
MKPEALAAEAVLLAIKDSVINRNHKVFILNPGITCSQKVGLYSNP